jgi:hypothetical protein
LLRKDPSQSGDKWDALQRIPTIVVGMRCRAAQAFPWVRRSSPTNLVNAAEEWPIFRAFDQPMANGILPDVLPFLRIALAITQPMMKSNFLKGASVWMYLREAVFPEGDPAFNSIQR